MYGDPREENDVEENDATERTARTRLSLSNAGSR